MGHRHLLAVGLAVSTAAALALPSVAFADELPPLPPSPLAGVLGTLPISPLPDLGAPRPDSGFAPIDQEGPALSVPQYLLDAALTCNDQVGSAADRTVLFVPGTTLTPQDNFAWNWFRAFDAQARPYCSVELPDNAMSDTQTAAEYVVNAIRAIHDRTGEKVQVLGYSQGGTQPRFALRFWPDLRDEVDDVVVLGATNHGSLGVDALCVAICSAALHQQRLNSQYTQAMNSYQETFAGISYTQIYSKTDEFVQPNLDDNGTTSLHTGDGAITNIALQDQCPGHVADHLALGSYDAVAYALADDALTHDGPADPARVDPAACTRLFQPGVDPITFATDFAAMSTVIARELALREKVAAEPALRPYTLARSSA